jgi:hypothetical protein
MEGFFHVQNITTIIQLNVTYRLSRMDHREYWECCMYLWATSGSIPILNAFRNLGGKKSVISGFRRGGKELVALLGCYAA